MLNLFAKYAWLEKICLPNPAVKTNKKPHCINEIKKQTEKKIKQKLLIFCSECELLVDPKIKIT